MTLCDNINAYGENDSKYKIGCYSLIKCLWRQLHHKIVWPTPQNNRFSYFLVHQPKKAMTYYTNGVVNSALRVTIAAVFVLVASYKSLVRELEFDRHWRYWYCSLFINITQICHLTRRQCHEIQWTSFVKFCSCLFSNYGFFFFKWKKCNCEQKNI